MYDNLISTDINHTKSTNNMLLSTLTEAYNPIVNSAIITSYYDDSLIRTLENNIETNAVSDYVMYPLAGLEAPFHRRLSFQAIAGQNNIFNLAAARVKIPRPLPKSTQQMTGLEINTIIHTTNAVHHNIVANNQNDGLVEHRALFDYRYALGVGTTESGLNIFPNTTYMTKRTIQAYSPNRIRLEYRRPHEYNPLIGETTTVRRPIVFAIFSKSHRYGRLRYSSSQGDISKRNYKIIAVVNRE